MSYNLRIITRVAVFASLVFIFSYFSVFLYNINLGFFVIFASGFLWGLWPGVGVGLVGYFLWSNFNPFGPVPFPLLLSQLVGVSLIALVGMIASRIFKPEMWNRKGLIILAISGFFSGLFYHLPVDIVDALLYQPFWPRLIGGLIFSLITIVSCGIIFPMFYPALAFLYKKEKNMTYEKSN
ncbi:MAG: hypothetical protein DRP51_09415 [Candidatus Zixiibacteriota bacterium]|nr:MAG: hypothetical protein DRP51_09415 [candidate division Zixibacteria bacterium]